MSNYSDNDYFPPPKAPLEEPLWYKTHKDEYGNQLNAESAKNYVSKWKTYFANDKTLGNLSDQDIIKILIKQVGGKRGRSRKQRKSRRSKRSRKQRRSRRRN
jgi:hypothetical protein